MVADTGNKPRRANDDGGRISRDDSTRERLRQLDAGAMLLDAASSSDGNAASGDDVAQPKSVSDAGAAVAGPVASMTADDEDAGGRDMDSPPMDAGDRNSADAVAMESSGTAVAAAGEHASAANLGGAGTSAGLAAAASGGADAEAGVETQGGAGAEADGEAQGGAGAGASAGSAGTSGEVAGSGDSDTLWTDAWFRAPLSAASGAVQPGVFVDQTLRLIVWPTMSGTQARVKLTNAYGSAPLTIGEVHAALRRTGGTIVPETDRTLSFGGATSATLDPGAELWSDPIALTVRAHTDLAISIYVPGTVTPASFHATGLKTSYLSSTGNYTGADTLPEPSSEATTTMVFFAAEVQVRSDAVPAQIVALGDSITDGYCSDVDSNGDWPDLLSARITRLPNFTPVGVINAGISSNRFMSSDAAGLRGLSRLPELLSRPGVRWVVLLEGVNDISYEHATADDLIAAYESAIALAHAARVKIFGVPLLPLAHSTKDTPENQATRATVNGWIRSSGAYDAVIDFEPTIADPADPTSMREELTCDHVHPNQAGYLALANSIDLSLFR